MNTDNGQKIYVTNHFSFFERILLRKRKEILSLLKEYLNKLDIFDILDVGTTEDTSNPSSNYLIKNLGEYKIYKSISDQKINSSFFSRTLKKSITENFTEKEIKEFQSDVVISNATIEHVGNFDNQIKMCSNIIKMAKKYFIILTPNRYHPLELHTLIPMAHWLPKTYHRKLLKFIGLNFYSDEKNLNLLSENDIRKMIEKEKVTYSFKYVRFLFFKSNLILFGEK